MNTTKARTTDIEKLKQNANGNTQAVATKKPDPAATLISIMEKTLPEIKKVIPKHITPERMTRTILTCIRKTPKLMHSDPASFLGALFSASQLGLEPGILGHCYLIPYEDKRKGIVECQFQIGYKGLIELARRSGKIARIECHTIYKSDIDSGRFELLYGSGGIFKFQPTFESRPTDDVPVLYVAYLQYKDGAESFTHLTKDDVLKIRDEYSPSAKYGSSPWQKFPEQMAHKTVLKRLLKFESLSPEQQQAAAFDEQIIKVKPDVDESEQYGDFSDVVDVSFGENMQITDGETDDQPS